MWVLIVLVVLIGALTGTLGQILEVAAGVVVGLILFVLGVILAAYYYVRHRFRRAARDWERARGQGSGGYPRRPYGELPPGPRDPDSV
jgi:Kef-type K+ transport system membrane component KefB